MRVLDYLNITPIECDVSAERKALRGRRSDYAGHEVAVGLDLQADMVIAAWPKIGQTAVCDFSDHIDKRLSDELESPVSCLLPKDARPAVTAEDFTLAFIIFVFIRLAMAS